LLRKSIHQTQYFLLRLVGVSGTNKILGESMTREKLIEKWQELEFEYNGIELYINYDQYTDSEIEEEIETLECCMEALFKTNV